ncbi:VOC family protein [Microbacterium sp. ASV49]|uniref:VOC family protein n=1 Tax=Microbacterium candidum TaxID=3041922 RepID=A0ABT7MWS6_9MICO|nr:VOC family protein [Microbacterium sp. ASV49]MDL9978903.1 VOC family protein [Microbacterium sp. ASV49]
MSILNPYISFKSNAREAMEFYQSVFGGTLDVSVFGDIPGMAQDPAENDLVMHAQLTTADGFTLMGSDTPERMPYSAPTGISLSISGDDEAKLEGFWNALAVGGEVTMPLDTPPWGGKFGMLNDRFGIGWMVSVNAAPAA